MSDEKPRRSVVERPDGQNETSAIQSWGQEVKTRAKTRRVKAENELGEQMVRFTDLQADLHDANGRAIAAQARNSDIETIKDKAAKQLRAELGEVEGQLQEQDVRAAKLDAEAAEILGRHEANKAEEVRRAKEAEAATLNAEIEIEQKRATLDRLRNDRGGMLAEAEAVTAKLCEELDVAEQVVRDLSLDPAGDQDESHTMRLQASIQKRDDLRAKLTVAEKRVDDPR